MPRDDSVPLAETTNFLFNLFTCPTRKEIRANREAPFRNTNMFLTPTVGQLAQLHASSTSTHMLSD